MRLTKIIVYLPLFAALYCAAAQSAAAQPAAAGKFDGSYKGVGTTKDGGNCQNFNSTLKVEGVSFSMHYNANLVITGTVTSGGALSGEGISSQGRGAMRTAKLSGQIAGAIATLTTDTQACHFDWKMTKAE